MVPHIVAAVFWQDSFARHLLEQVQARYRSTPEFSCVLRFECTKTPVGRQSPPGRTESAVFQVSRSGERYRVVPDLDHGGAAFNATARASGSDPYTVYDHHLTWLLGIRSSALGHRLAGQGARGPYFSFFRSSGRRTAVYETYVPPSRTPFVLTYLLDTADNTVVSVSTCGIVQGFGQARPGDHGILWTESVVLDQQAFGA
jgi:hypothetical protein